MREIQPVFWDVKAILQWLTNGSTSETLKLRHGQLFKWGTREELVNAIVQLDSSQCELGEDCFPLIDSELVLQKRGEDTYLVKALRDEEGVNGNGRMPPGGNSVTAKRVDLSYDANSNLTGIQRFEGLNTTPAVAQTTQVYDAMGRLASIQHKDGATVLAGYAITWDSASRITQIDSAADGIIHYTNDSTGQLTSEDPTGTTNDRTYGYDANGTRNISGYTIGSNNQITSDGTYTYSYDQEGNRTRKTKISDGSYTEYSWDYRNRLVAVTENDVNGTVLKQTSLDYDAYNRWIHRSHDADGMGSAGAVDTFYSFLGDQVSLAIESGGEVQNRYLWGPGTDQLLADEQIANNSSNVLWALGNQIGTVADLVDYNATTGEVAVANHRRYDAFGNLIIETDASVDEFFTGLAGKAFDEAIGLQNNLNRWFDADLGQWLNEDPIGFKGGDKNVRRYGTNNVLAFFDPDGLKVRGKKEQNDASLREYYQSYLNPKLKGLRSDLPQEDQKRGEILLAMINAPYELVFNGDSPCENAMNIELHLDARFRMIRRTEVVQFGFGAPHLHFEPFKPQYNDGEELFQALNNPSTTMHCQDAQKWIWHAAGERETFSVNVGGPGQVVPGDMIYIQNDAHQIYKSEIEKGNMKGGEWDETFEGENTIALGNGIFWGHTSDDKKTHSFKEWEDLIKTWRSASGECGIPRFIERIKIPSTGLDRSFYIKPEEASINNNTNKTSPKIIIIKPGKKE